MKTFAIMPLGCKVNDYEATYVRNGLLKRYKEVSFKEIADIYIIFTCCVTNTAEAKTRKFLHRPKKLNKDAFVIAVGCLSQIKGKSDDFKDVDLIIGSNHKDEIIELIDKHFEGNLVENLNDAKFEELPIENYPEKSRAFLKIQDGCNQFCSYCIIPYARGRERSANHKFVLEEAEKLSKTYHEIVLTGIHTGRYFDGEYNLYMLLKDLIKIENLDTIRLSSIEITELTDEIIELMKTSKKLAHHLHIPVQATSNEILNLMHRPYSIEQYIERISYIRKEINDISISTDLIVGFPNETDEIFESSLNNLKECSFSFIHVFPYARKNRTVADRIDNHVHEQTKKYRVKRIMELESEFTYKIIKSFENSIVQVMIEKNDDTYSYGYSKQYFYVKIKGIFEIGKLINVRIISVNNNEIIGEYVTI